MCAANNYTDSSEQHRNIERVRRHRNLRPHSVNCSKLLLSPRRGSLHDGGLDERNSVRVSIPVFSQRAAAGGLKKRYSGHEIVVGATVKKGEGSCFCFPRDLAFRLRPLLSGRSLPPTQGVG